MQKITITLKLSTGIYGSYGGKTVTGYQAYIDTVPVVVHKEASSRYWTVSEPRTGLALKHHAGTSRQEALRETETYLAKALQRSNSFPTLTALIEETIKTERNN